jgi:hypothetical protein
MAPPSPSRATGAPAPGQLGRRASNPFTRNQDLNDELEASNSAASVISRFRNASIGSLGSRRTSGSYGAIEEGSDEEGLPPLAQQRTPADLQRGGAEGSGTGVSKPASDAAPAGLPLEPELAPAGGSQRHVFADNVKSPDVAYDKRAELEQARSSSDARGNQRSRGLIRTYSMVSGGGRRVGCRRSDALAGPTKAPASNHERRPRHSPAASQPR